MNNLLGSALSLLAVFFASGLALGERVFTSADGKKMTAEIVGATETHVTLRKTTDKREYTIPLERLSDTDQEYVSDWRRSQELNTREAKEITLALEGGGEKKVKVPQGQHLSPDGTLTLYPGEEIHLEFQEAEGKLAIPRVVAKVAAPHRTITFSMTQKAEITMLFRKTKIQQTVAMDCEHRGLGSDKFFRTNLFPTEKGLAAGDSWPGTVWTLRLSNFEVTDQSATKAYEERVSK